MPTILKQYEVKEEQIMELADTMAASAAAFSSHGYDLFVQSRDTLRERLHQLFESLNQAE